MLKQVKEFDCEGESLLLAKVAKMLRRALANFNGFQVDGYIYLSTRISSISTQDVYLYATEWYSF